MMTRVKALEAENARLRKMYASAAIHPDKQVALRKQARLLATGKAG